VITAAGGDLAYVTLTLEDAHGTLCTGDDRPVIVTVSGDGALAGFGSANPSTEEPFSATTRRTYQGRALAVLRPTGPGTMRLRASSPGCDPAETVIAIE
jgi:beta-galactosidase